MRKIEDGKHVKVYSGLYARYFKRAVDVTLSLAAILLLWPLMAAVALLVRLKLGAPVIFAQRRPGRGEQMFTLHKFRTMENTRAPDGMLLPDGERMTAFGRFLRETSLDELLELFDILRGKMSLVGPRPLLPQYLDAYTPKERARHTVRPGLTGLAQVSGRNFLPWNERLALDAAYTRNITFIGDMRLILKTAVKILRRADVCADTDRAEGNLAEIRACSDTPAV